jgi:acetyl-CoA carboxylase biotin carboxyl carrier protein
MIDIDTLKEYIKVLEDSSLAEIEISDDEDSIRLAKPTADSPMVSFSSTAPQAPAEISQQPVSRTQPAPKAPVASDKTIKSPMVGVFYAAPSPEKPAFVSVGDTVAKGDVVCIIEAMKIMNEIVADESGTITEVLVNNGDLIEYDQPLFRLG